MWGRFRLARSRPDAGALPLLATSKTDTAILFPALTLVEAPRCPRCCRATWGHWKRSGDGIHKCERTRCGQHWWTMVIEEGPVLAQLEWAFEDATIARHLVEQYRLPAELTQPMYWQLPLTANQVHNHHRSKLAVLFRAVGVLKDLLR